MHQDRNRAGLAVGDIGEQVPAAQLRAVDRLMAADQVADAAAEHKKLALVHDQRLRHLFESGGRHSEIVSLHIRRGDYINDPNFDCLSIDYYYKTLKLMPEVPVLVITNDKEWCQEKFNGERFIVSPFKDACIDLCLMSLSDYHHLPISYRVGQDIILLIYEHSQMLPSF